MELPISRSIPEKMIYEKSLKSMMDTYRRARYLHKIIVNRPNVHQAELLKIAQMERKWAPETSRRAIRYMIERNWVTEEKIGQNVFFRSASPQLVNELVLRDEIKEREEEFTEFSREYTNYSYVEKLRMSAYILDNLLDLLNLVILKETMTETGRNIYKRYENNIRILMHDLFRLIKNDSDSDSRSVLSEISREHFLPIGYSSFNAQKHASAGNIAKNSSTRQSGD